MKIQIELPIEEVLTLKRIGDYRGMDSSKLAASVVKKFIYEVGRDLPDPEPEPGDQLEFPFV